MPRTDDDVTDEALGESRVAAAAASRARKEAEKRALASQNKGFFEMLAGVTAKTDDGDGLSTAVVKK